MKKEKKSIRNMKSLTTPNFWMIGCVYIYIYLSLPLSDTHVRMLEDCVLETIQEQNKLAAGSDRSVLIPLSAGVTLILTQLAGS